ncbi:MAG: aldolase/citrate lyase family protein [Acidimicrobiales bacterium]|nr:aldolase/citrate lyase family protein [Acidimicrobiales bacterium]
MPVSLATARSFFIAPGADLDGLRAALESPAHAVIVDLEDLVPVDQKAAARANARALLAEPRATLKIVRVNAPDTEHWAADLAAIADLPIDAILLPKASPSMVQMLGTDGPPIIGLVESGDGVRLAYEIAMLPRVVALAIAPGDLGKDLKLEIRPDGQSLLYARSKLVVDSSAAGIRSPIDIPSAAVGDALRADVALSRSLGLWGRLCLKPGQAAVINEAFDGAR